MSAIGPLLTWYDGDDLVIMGAKPTCHGRRESVTAPVLSFDVGGDFRPFQMLKRVSRQLCHDGNMTPKNRVWGMG
jgi:hypothetical protein